MPVDVKIGGTLKPIKKKPGRNVEDTFYGPETAKIVAGACLEESVSLNLRGRPACNFETDRAANSTRYTLLRTYRGNT